MEILKIEGTSSTPYICFDKEGGIFEISGRSLSDHIAEFYGPVLSWIRNYNLDPNPTTELVIKLEYANTASSKLILDILSSLEASPGAKIIWWFQEDDEDMEETGEEFAELVHIPFEFKAF